MAGAMRKVGEYLGLVEQADFDDTKYAAQFAGGKLRAGVPIAGSWLQRFGAALIAGIGGFVWWRRRA